MERGYDLGLTTVGNVDHNHAAFAWCNFNGTGTPAINDSENVSSLTDNGVGDYSVVFIDPLIDASDVGFGGSTLGGTIQVLTTTGFVTTGVRVLSGDANMAAAADASTICVVVFGRR